MTRSQLSTIRRLTTWANKLTAMDGGLHFKIETESEDRKITIIGSNGHCTERPWYAEFYFFYATVGPRGGIKLYAHDGFKKQHLLK